MLGVRPARSWGRFHVVDIADDASIDYVDAPGPFGTRLAFLVSDAEFDPDGNHLECITAPYAK